MKKYSLLFLLLVPLVLGAQDIGTIYQASTITKLMEGDCRTKRLMEESELVVHPRFKTIQFTSLRDLYQVKDSAASSFFPYYVFREIGEGLILEAKGTTDGLLAVTVRTEGVYYAIWNRPDCVLVVRLEVGVASLIGEAVLYECCLLVEDLN